MTTDELYDMVRDLQRRFDNLESRLEVLEYTVSDHGTQIDELSRDVAEKSDIEGLESRMDDLENLQVFVRARLKRSCRYLRAECGRTETEAPRRILNAAMKAVGTDATVDLRSRSIAARLGKEKPCY